MGPNETGIGDGWADVAGGGVGVCVADGSGRGVGVAPADGSGRGVGVGAVATDCGGTGVGVRGGTGVGVRVGAGAVVGDNVGSVPLEGAGLIVAAGATVGMDDAPVPLGGVALGIDGGAVAGIDVAPVPPVGVWLEVWAVIVDGTDVASESPESVGAGVEAMLGNDSGSPEQAASIRTMAAITAISFKTLPMGLTSRFQYQVFEVLALDGSPLLPNTVTHAFGKIARKAGTRGTMYFPLIHLATFTGMRRSELLGLRWKDVNLTRGTVSVAQVLHCLPGGRIVLATRLVTALITEVEAGPWLAALFTNLSKRSCIRSRINMVGRPTVNVSPVISSWRARPAIGIK